MADVDDVDFLTVKQFAERHKGLMSVDMIGDAVRRNELPHVRLGKRIYIPANALSVLQERQAAALREAQVTKFGRGR